MSRRIPVQDVFREWEKDPVFRAEYDSLEDEFTLATALIKAWPTCGPTQADENWWPRTISNHAGGTPTNLRKCRVKWCRRC